MIVTIHQPEHFPYMGFFQKMAAADLFVILDHVKFKKNDYQNRNRFINRSGVEEWFTVPVEKDANSKEIKDVLTSRGDGKWRKSIVKQIQFNLKHDVTQVYEAGERLVDINMASIEWCRQKLGIKTPMVLSSDMGLEGKKTDLLIEICRKTEATVYLSGSGGKDYLEEEKFEQSGIRLEYFRPQVENYMSAVYNVR